MKKLSLLFLTSLLITSLFSLGTKKRDSVQQAALNYIRRCPGTDKFFRRIKERKKYFKEHFTARPIKNSFTYKCGIIECSTKKNTFKTERLCWDHMLVANKNHNKNLQEQKIEKSINQIIKQPIEDQTNQSDELGTSNDEDDLVTSGDSYQPVEEEQMDPVVTETTTSSSYNYFTDTSYQDKLEPLFSSAENKFS